MFAIAVAIVMLFLLYLFLLHKLFKVPIAVWTLRTKEAYIYAKKHYNIRIFENFREIY